MEPTVLEAALTGVTTALETGVAAIGAKVPVVIAAGIGLALIPFGVSFVKKLLKGTAR